MFKRNNYSIWFKTVNKLIKRILKKEEEQVLKFLKYFSFNFLPYNDIFEFQNYNVYNFDMNRTLLRIIKIKNH